MTRFAITWILNVLGHDPINRIANVTDFKKISSLFILGVKDFKLDDEFRSFLSEYRPGGLALFNSPWDSADNIWNDPDSCLEQVYEFVKKLEDDELFLAADQEGGRVRRFRGPYIKLPSAQEISGYAKNPDNSLIIEKIYRSAAKQLSLSGFHLNFAPVCDLKTSESHDVIGDRSYGSSPDEILKQVETFCRVFEEEGIHTTLKHLPGHGPTNKDSHDEIAVVFKNKEEFLKEDSVC